MWIVVQCSWLEKSTWCEVWTTAASSFQNQWIVWFSASAYNISVCASSQCQAENIVECLSWLFSSAVGNCSPARHARFCQPAIAGWRIKKSKKGWRKGGEVGRGLSKFQKIIDIYGRIKYHLPFSKVKNFNSRPKQGRIPQIPYENRLLFLIWTLRSVDPMIPIEFLS